MPIAGGVRIVLTQEQIDQQKRDREARIAAGLPPAAPQSGPLIAGGAQGPNGENAANIVLDLPKPPTPEAAAKNIEPEGIVPKTYGRRGTIKNSGGFRGLAASTLNLSSNSLTGN